jgi:hypothetical protein
MAAAKILLPSSAINDARLITLMAVHCGYYAELNGCRVLCFIDRLSVP